MLRPAFLSAILTAAVGASDPSWYQYVRAPSSRMIPPQSIVSTSGNVTNANALVGGGGVATLTRPTPSDTIPKIVLDFGQNIVGFPQLTFTSATNNAPGIRLAFSETMEYLGTTSDFTRSDNGDTITPGTDQFATPQAPTVWNDRHGCLYNGKEVCADGLHGFRYMSISLDALQSDEPYISFYGVINISEVLLNFTAYLGTPDTFTGNFECSDAALTQYWYDAAYTTEMVTDTFLPNYVDPRGANSSTLDGKQVIFDGAKRDRDPYVGDLAVSGLSAYLSHFSLASAAKTVLADLAAHQRSDGWIPPASIFGYTLALFDYPLWWVVSSWDYILYTGDTQYASETWQALVNLLNNYYPSQTDENHLLVKPSGYGDYAFLPRTGEVTYYNALYVMALVKAAAWAETMSQSAQANSWVSTAGTVASAINDILWDPSKKAYFDSNDTSLGVFHPQDGNSIAILAGLTNTTTATDVLNYLLFVNNQEYGNAFYDAAVPNVPDANERVYAFLSYFEISARFATPGQDPSAIDQIRRTNGWMATHDPEITMWEGIGAGGSPYEGGFTSMAHGWSTGVLPLLSNYVLGVTPTGPGFSTWTLEPHTSGLQWANGTVQTPHGDINVSWEINSQGEVVIGFNVPSGTVATVGLPGTPGQTVNGANALKQDSIGEGRIGFKKVPAGEYHLEVV